MAGISEATFYSWMERGEAGEEPYAEFRDAVEQANADAEQILLAHVVAAAPDDWRAALEVLKRRFPDHWRDTSRLEHAGARGEPVRLEVSRERASEVLEVLRGSGALTTEQQRALEAGDG